MLLFYRSSVFHLPQFNWQDNILFWTLCRTEQIGTELNYRLFSFDQIYVTEMNSPRNFTAPQSTNIMGFGECQQTVENSTKKLKYFLW